MHWRLLGLGLLISSTAAAQPADWSPIDSSGWPHGRSLEDLRELRECGPGELDVREGGAIGCRPPTIIDGAQIGFGVDWSSGPAFGSDLVAGGAHALGVELDYALSRRFQLAGRYELIGIAPSTMSPTTASLGHHFFGIAKARLFTDEVGRDAWTLGAGAGFALRPTGIGGSAPIARVSLAREVGHYVDDAHALTATAELAYERTLDDDALSLVLASYRLGFELNIREPRNLGRPAPRPSPWRTITGDAYLGNAIGLGMSMGVRLGRVLSLQTSAGFQFGTSEFTKQHGYGEAAWSLIAGPRVSVPRSVVHPYLQIQAGPAWTALPEGPELRTLGHAEIGMRLLPGCRATIDAGFWMRGDVGDRELASGGLLMRVGHGPGSNASCGSLAPTFATRPPPPEPIPPVEGGGSVTVGYETPSLPSPPSVGGSVGGSVEVDVRVPSPPPAVAEVQPIVLDVELGIAVPGLAIRIDPRLLPLHRLRGARHVTIELSGPGYAIASMQAQLSASISRSGARVDAWGSTISDSPRLRARITIRP